jgi:putative transposase
VKYAFMKENQEIFKIRRMCHVFSVSSSGYYDWCRRGKSQHQLEDERLESDIKSFFEEGRKTYGTRRIKDDFAAQGEQISRPRIARLMKKQGLVVKTKKKFKNTTDSNHERPVAENLLNREFSVEAPNQVYTGDITYIWTDEGWLYLAVVLDLFSRQVVGWSMSARMKAQLVVSAMTMACERRSPDKGLMFHSDRGSQYASAKYQKLLEDREFVCSMSRKGNCWDNAPSESFFRTLKTELVHHYRFRTRQEAMDAIFEYIEVFYNRQRKHSTLGYINPTAYEQAFYEVAA